MRLKINSVVIPLIVINIIFFILQSTLGNNFTSTFMLISKDIFTRPWTIITSMFLHGGTTHLFFNMYALLLFGNLIEQKVGKIRFLWVYFTSGILASLAFAFFRPASAAVGASGAIMGILGVTIILLPHLRVLFFFFIPMSMRTAGIIMALVDAFGLFPGVAGTAHLGGMACGLIFGLYFKKRKGKLNKRFASKTHLNDEDMDAYIRDGKI